MTRRVVFSPAARRDLLRLADFLVERSPAAALRAVAQIEGAVRGLKTHPESGAPQDVGVRDLIIRFGSGAYIVRYDFTDDVVTVTRIWHGREARRGA